ncbi:MAG: T9SS type A sorting domain-containing protein [Flavobacteriales bacterium]
MAALLVATTLFSQWSFQLDTSFRTSITQRTVNSIIELNDGRLFASGLIRYSGDLSDRGSTILLPNGERDMEYTGFFGGGRIIPWLNGQFYVPAGLPRRMTADGLIDPSFQALYDDDYFVPGQTADYHVYPDGRVLISGQHLLRDSLRGYVGNYNLIWFTNTGYLDTTKMHRRANGPIWEFKELADGKFICTCSCTQYEGQPVSKLFRVHADGALDTTFQAGVNWGNIYEFLPLADGSFYAAGKYRRTMISEDTLYLARFLPSGSMDATFQPPAFSPLDLPNPFTGAVVTFLYPWEGGRLIATGRFLSVNNSERSGICMIDDSGNVLDAFDGCGVAPWTYQNFTYVSIEEIRPAGEDTLYICGAYVGFDDCQVNDTLQRFVSRLLVSDLPTTVAPRNLGDGPVVRVYPNPTRSWVVLTYDQPTNTATGSIEVKDLSGRQVASFRMTGTSGQQFWDTSKLAQGTYTIHYQNEGRTVHTERLVIQ